MADIVRYGEYALLFGSTSVAFEPGSLEAGNDARIDDLTSGASMNPLLRQVIGKGPYIKATILDPSLVTTWAEYGSGKTITLVKAIWRAYAENGGFGAGYLSASSAKGVIFPVSLSASATRKATLDVVARAIFATGTGLTIGTDSATLAAITKAYYPTNVIIGSDTITQVQSVQVNWQYQTQDDDQLEPTYFYYDRYALRGTATVKDVSKATAVRLEDGATETCSVLLTDANNGSNTVTVSLGSCHVMATRRGDTAVITFEDIG